MLASSFPFSRAPAPRPINQTPRHVTEYSQSGGRGKGAGFDLSHLLLVVYCGTCDLLTR